MHYGRDTGKKILYIQVVKNPQDLDCCHSSQTVLREQSGYLSN